MKVSEASIEDGKQMAHLLKAISTCTVAGADVELLAGVKRWLHNLALQIAEQVRSLPGVVDEGAAETLKPKKEKPMLKKANGGKSIGKRKK